MGTATDIDLYVHAHAYMYVSLRVRVSGLRAVNKLTGARGTRTRVASRVT